MPTEKDKLLAGELDRPDAPEIQADLAAAQAWLARYNASLGLPPAERRMLLLERLAEVGAGVDVRPPFHCDYGFNIRLGPNVFLNFNCVILDVVEVTIGEGTQIGPAVQIYAADHPRDATQRRAGLELGRPVRIGRHVSSSLRPPAKWWVMRFRKKVPRSGFCPLKMIADAEAGVDLDEKQA